ncbi:MAG TPA: C25 family peptidase propeptide domain-containing protein, partial [Anaerolineaceae bacterium]|nr:C25 family peptidase propeptide domain-containing protein [Anaerolineaceae bacterium]
MIPFSLMVLIFLVSSNFIYFDLSSRSKIPSVHYEYRNDSIFLSIETQTYEWVGNHQGKSIIFKEAETLSNPGYPDLPYKSVLLSIPPDLDLIPKVNKTNFKSISSPTNLHISEFPIDESFHEKLLESKGVCELIMPQQPVEIGDPFWHREYYLVSIKFYPIRWDCKSSSFVWNERIELELDFGSVYLRKSNNGFDASDPEYLITKEIINHQDNALWETTPPVLWGGELQNPWETRVKSPVSESGIYRITYEDLEMINFPLTEIDPHFFHMENQG